MPDPSWYTVESSSDLFDFATDWQEDLESPPTCTGSSTDMSATLNGYIPYNKMRDAYKKILGYAYADTEAPWKLHRVNPVRHPHFPWLYAASINAGAYNLVGDPSNPNKEAYRPAAVPSASLSKHGRWTRTRVSINFKPLPYPVVEDSAMGSLPEYYRNTAIFDTTDPQLELLTAQTEKYMIFVEGGEGVTDQEYPGTTYERLTKISFVMIWFNVPVDYIQNPYRPDKILNCVGKVNRNNNWLTGDSTGFPSGTLLLNTPKLTRRQFQLWTTGLIPFCVDIVLPFSYFDPTPAVSPSVYRGWNLFTRATTGKWYSSQRKGSKNTGDPQKFDDERPLIKFADFDTMFTHVQS